MDAGLFQHLIGQRGDIVWWQMTIRALIVFVYGLLLVRIAGQHAFGKSAPLDIIVSVLIGSNLSRALTANAPLLATLAATTGLFVVYWLVLYAAFFFKPVSWLVKGRSLPLVRDGEVDWEMMKRAGITEGDLAEAMRTNGIEQLQELHAAYRERNGNISIIKKK